MDAFAVSVSSGITARHPLMPKALRMAFFFGAFQAIMPIIGYFAGMTVVSYIESVDHYIAFGLLAFVGGKMLLDGIRGQDEHTANADSFAFRTLTVLAVATSIDALAVGLSFAAISANIWFSALVIGIITFFLSYLGVYFGKRLGNTFEQKAEIVGGIVLILIGLKILLEHLAVL